ncbi:MAG: protocatechuate 3,4-dioxygenase subunit alpha, partial [Pseudomonadales bacterium]
MVGQTPSQTVGPYFYFALLHGGDNILVVDRTRGDRIRIEGHVWDGAGEPVTDAMVEIWQANAAGRYCHADDDQEK